MEPLLEEKSETGTLTNTGGLRKDRNIDTWEV